MRKLKLSTVLSLFAILLLVLPASAATNTTRDRYPEVIPLPDGFRPEGIAVGRGAMFFTGSLANGAIYRGDLRSGEGDILVPGEEGMVSVGMSYDRRSNALFVAGGATGLARVFDAESGELLQTYTLSESGSFINDVIVTRKAAYFTNSNEAVLYRLPFGRHGELPEPDEVETLTLSGDWSQVEGFNANGIEATRNGKWLVVVNSTVGNLYRVDPESGEATVIDLGGQSVSMGDGLLFRGSRFYVVRNRLNQIVEIDLSRDLLSGKVTNTLTDSDFNVPTTIVDFGHALYAVNAKFGDPNPNTIPYEIVRVELK